MRKKTYFMSLCLICFSINLYPENRDWVSYVNTLQGTDSKFEFSHGNTYPTTALPWGMNFWTPQTGVNRNGWIYQYSADSIRGFRQTHQCSPWMNDYAAFSLMPVVGYPDANQYKRAARFRHENEIAKPHYYKVGLENKVSVEMSPTVRGVHFRFSFPDSERAFIVIDGNSGGSMVKIIPAEQKVIGYCRNSIKTPENFTNYFVIEFDKPFNSFGTWQGPEALIKNGVTFEEGEWSGAILEFNKGVVVQAKVASSFISEAQAERNLKKELEEYKNFEETKTAARKIWNEYLGKIEIEGGTDEQKSTFYSCFFRSMLFPRQFYEYDEEMNPVYYSPYDGKIHKGYMYTDNGFWDTFRAQFPLNNILFPEMNGKYMQSLVDAFEQSNWLPSWSAPGHRGGMIGNHSFSLFADAYAKGVRSFDVEKALEAILHEATNKGPFGPSTGRDGWKEYFILGYLPYPDYENSTAKTLEYCYDDFCAMEMARLANKPFYQEIFQKTIYNYKNVFDPSVRFMSGRGKEGNWLPHFDSIEWGGPFIEGSSWHYTWSVFHDIQGLINLMGGNDNFIAKLDSVFSVPPTFKTGTYRREIHEMTEMAVINMGQYAHGNQPVQHVVYLYNYAGQPWKTQKLIRTVMNNLYNSGPDGFCGDEDQGQMSAWYVMSALGLYAVCPGTTEYVIGSPLLNKATIHLENGKEFIIDAVDNSENNVYIQSALLNGEPFSHNFIDHDDIEKGGKLTFVMGSIPEKSRGTGIDDRPFSVSLKGSFENKR